MEQKKLVKLAEALTDFCLAYPRLQAELQSDYHRLPEALATSKEAKRLTNSKNFREIGKNTLDKCFARRRC